MGIGQPEQEGRVRTVAFRLRVPDENNKSRAAHIVGGVC